MALGLLSPFNKFPLMHQDQILWLFLLPAKYFPKAAKIISGQPTPSTDPTLSLDGSLFAVNTAAFITLAAN